MSEENLTFFAEMGFSKENSQKALKLHNDNVQEALEWLIAHQDELNQQGTDNVEEKPTLKLSAKLDESPQKACTSSESAEVTDETANSLKCDDCGQLLKDEDFATLHAHKTGHVNFSQSTEAIKPKTKEEIEEQKKRLQEKLIKLRADRAQKEKEDQIQSEISRRKNGRQIHEYRQKFQEDEMKRIAAETRRDKIVDAAHKQKVKDGIAADRAAAKLARETEAAKAAGLAPPAQPVTPPQKIVINEQKTYDECRIQVRLTDGKCMVEKFRATEQLAAVRVWVERNRTDEPGGFNLMTTFPRKVYNDEEMMMSLKDLGLVPASSLVVSKTVTTADPAIF